MSAGLKVLVADPSPVMRRVLELTFAREGIQVVSLADGARVVDALPHERPDVVIADQGLPHRDGYDIVAFVRADPALASVPVLLTAGAFEAVDRDRAAQAGCADVFIKPFDPERLVARVRQLAAGPAPARADADSYFEQLSAALDARDRVRPRPHATPVTGGEAEEGSVPTLDSVLRDRE